uniref:Usher syndrome type-1G protein-like protein n=1 Tax=Noccaea caerulescens TaxID=107243 RepID=A0A1J3H7Y4_NOCCA
MYSDQVEAKTESRKTVKSRLNGGSGDFSSHGRQVTRKRGRQDDDKWEHDLFEDDDKPRISKRRVDPKDLRLKLQKKHHGLQSRLGASLGVGDLREKLSGTVNSQPKNSNLAKSIREAARPAVKKVSGETKSETRATLNKAIKKKTQQADMSVDSFLESLGLEKYATAFQVEEVDMDALMHMTDDDLKALLIPLGPRKKILLALGSKD